MPLTLDCVAFSDTTKLHCKNKSIRVLNTNHNLTCEEIVPEHAREMHITMPAFMCMQGISLRCLFHCTVYPVLQVCFLILKHQFAVTYMINIFKDIWISFPSEIKMFIYIIKYVNVGIGFSIQVTECSVVLPPSGQDKFLCP